MRRRLLQLLLAAAAAAVATKAAAAAEEKDAASEEMAEADFPKTAAIVAKDAGKNEARGKSERKKNERGCVKWVFSGRCSKKSRAD